MVAKLLRHLSRLLRPSWVRVLALVSVIIAINYLLMPREPPPPQHTIFRTTNLYSLWQQPAESAGFFLAASGNSCVYGAYHDWVRCTDLTTGRRLWSSQISSGHGGARSLIATDKTVYRVGTQAVDALDATTGLHKWSTFLGHGHVRIVAQLESSFLRVYYGDQIFELDLGTGAILRSLDLGDILWMEGNIEVHVGADHASTWAVDESGRTLWHSPGALFSVSESHPPLPTSPDRILALSEDERLCRFHVRNGEYDWCLAPSQVLAYALTSDRTIGFAITPSSTIVSFRVSDGALTASTQFLPVPTPSSSAIGPYLDYALVTTPHGVVVRFDDSMQVFSLGYRSNYPSTP